MTNVGLFASWIALLVCVGIVSWYTAKKKQFLLTAITPFIVTSILGAPLYYAYRLAPVFNETCTSQACNAHAEISAYLYLVVGSVFAVSAAFLVYYKYIPQNSHV